MIIFFEKGRLGNQLFQYCAMRKFQPNGLIFAVGMNELRNNFSVVNIVGVSKLGRIVEKIVTRFGEKLVENAAARLRLITMVEEERSSSGIRFRVKRGFFNNQVYFKGGHYQSEDIVLNSISEHITPNQEFQDIAERYHNSLKGERINRFFVHVRRGDYTNWPNSESPAVLPITWYRKQMDHVRRRNPKALFVVASDDKAYLDEYFVGETDVSVISGDLMSDFSILANCSGGGILSASSFSWWIAFFIRRYNNKAFFIAPKYWAGFRRREWFPECICTSWINYEDVF